jgi:murein DD-endopeptidase MepM/ murein hydrolase activator NlpD
MRSLLLASVLVLTTSATVSAEFDPSVFFVVPEEPAQGDIVRVTMNLPKGAKGGTVTFLGRTYPGFVTGGLLNVYVGIDMDTDPGAHPIKYDFGVDSGAREITVKTKLFDTERLTVASKYTDLDEATQARVSAETERLTLIWAETSPQRLWNKSFVKPALGPNGSPFGLRRFFNGQPRSPHSGLDIKAPEGSEVYASNAGKVVLAGELFFTGNTVIVDHGFGLYTLYAHLQRVDVAEGDEIERSQRLGLVGQTGRVTGPHLHWAAKLGGARVDPATLPGVLL